MADSLPIRVFNLVGLFELLAVQGVPPFERGAIDLVDVDDLNWEKLPRELRYLADPAVRYHRHADLALSGEDPRLTMFERQELRQLAKMIRDRRHYSGLLNVCLNEFPIDEHRESSLVYHLCGLLDALDFDLE